MFSDLFFRVDVNNNEGYIYFLFEHKSYKDKLVIFQLLRYMIEIWESKIKKENNNKLPIIILLLIYHDKGHWNIKTKLSEMISIASQISVKGSELVMTVAEQLRQEGIREGIKEGIIKIAKNAIVKGLKEEDIIELTGLTKKEIDKIRKDMLQ